jgi:serine/threonine-protein kinase
VAVLAVGDLIDSRYELVKWLGEGAFGEVWKARDCKFPKVQRFVALKFLKRALLREPSIVARFEQEADALGALQHGNVIAVSDRGDWKGGRYIVMEFVEGGTLEEWLDEHAHKGRLPDLPSVQRVFDQICAGVAAAHAVEIPGPIVHRDLKPENVLLRRGEDGLLAKVVDFGIARLGARSPQTRTGARMGTPVYMAPEQDLGKSGDIGPWTDVFGLGVILVQMLSLRMLPDAGANEAWCDLVRRDETKARLLLGGLRPDVPSAVWDVAAKALRRDGTHRFVNAGELRRALRDAWGAVLLSPALGFGPPAKIPVERRAARSLAPERLRHRVSRDGCEGGETGLGCHVREARRLGRNGAGRQISRGQEPLRCHGYGRQCLGVGAGQEGPV